LGLLNPSAGTARTLDLEPREAVRSGRVGAMLQSAGLPPNAQVGELVDLARALYPSPLSRDAVLERAGLSELAGRRVETLSGGESQRVRFAFAIAGDPDLVFLDEPRSPWTSRAAGRSGRTCAGSRPRAARCCSRPTTSTRPTRSRTGSSSSTAAGSSVT